MIVSNTARTARPPRTSARTFGAPDGANVRPAPGYIRLYRHALLRNELLRNIEAASRMSPACIR